MFRRRSRAAKVAAVAAVAAVSLTLAACSGSSDTGSAGGSADASSESGTLKLWHYESANGAMGIAWDKAIEISRPSTRTSPSTSNARLSSRSSRTRA